MAVYKILLYFRKESHGLTFDENRQFIPNCLSRQTEDSFKELSMGQQLLPVREFAQKLVNPDRTKQLQEL